MHDEIQRSLYNTSRKDRSPQSLPPLILVVTRNGRVSESVMKYTLDIADRLGYNILVAYVDTLPFLLDGGRRSQRMQAASRENIALYREMAAGKNIQIKSVKESGKVGKVIYRLCQIVRKIDFVVVDKDINTQEAASWAPVPVFNINAGLQSYSRFSVNRKRNSRKKTSPVHRDRWQKYALKSVLLSGLLLSLYTLLFYNSDQIMTYWTKGGVYTVFPIVTVCVFFSLQTALIETCISALKKEKKLSDTTFQAVLQSKKILYKSFL